ncbi:MAG TPA: undecaprenyldiphospho-muramoylpentapeptide beta-N-acetylglucosaminyltransferase [Xanthobacteraceae bacterium]|nr:undecaprenyldiphospho-muramoylpentapeptide beta-N-acetylglucosaminyltransferase [Xanthobacteraceae bacterium]
MQGSAPLVVVAAGGTGGHLFPAEALAVALARRGAAVDLTTDARATRYGQAFPARATHVLRSATPRGRNPISLIRAGIVLALGTAEAVRLFGRLRPSVVVGFGGYPTVPPLLAATIRRIPTVIHEQNGVMGRANRFLSGRVDAIATGFPGLLADNPALARKVTHTGNPVRPAVIAAAATPYEPPRPGEPLRLLVFGGSQGARVMADIVPAAVARLPEPVRGCLSVVQQAREEDLGRVKQAYEDMGVTAEIAPFFADLPARMAAAHLVVGRSGASTVAELAAIGRPAILVPLPHALDQDQRANAGVLEKAGGAIRLDQALFTPERLAADITALAADPDRLAAMAAAARSVGTVDAAERLADLVLATGNRSGNRVSA